MEIVEEEIETGQLETRRAWHGQIYQLEYFRLLEKTKGMKRSVKYSRELDFGRKKDIGRILGNFIV